jgi:TPR repeat protein
MTSIIGGLINMRLLAIMLSILLICSLAYADDCNDGLSAYAKGNYQEAIRIFEPLASRGDDCAQYQLGEMYRLGQGVKQDKQKALELFSDAAVHGNQKAKLQKALLER